MRKSMHAHLGEALRRGGIAPRHVRRIIRELDEHRDDLLAELQSQGLPAAENEAEATRRLGSDSAIIASALARSELKSWARRWPWLAFAALPLIALPMLIVVALFALSLLVEFAQHRLGNGPVIDSLHGFAAAFVASILWLLPPLCAAGCCVYALRRHAPLLWPIIGVVLVSLLGATVNASIDWPSAASQGALTAGFGFSTETLSGPSIRAAVTLLVALTPYIYVWRRRQEAGPA